MDAVGRLPPDFQQKGAVVSPAEIGGPSREIDSTLGMRITQAKHFQGARAQDRDGIAVRRPFDRGEAFLPVRPRNPARLELRQVTNPEPAVFLEHKTVSIRGNRPWEGAVPCDRHVESLASRLRSDDGAGTQERETEPGDARRDQSGHEGERPGLRPDRRLRGIVSGGVAGQNHPRLADVAQPNARVLLQAAAEQASHVSRKPGGELRPVGLALDDPRQDVRQRLALDDAPTRQALVEHAAEGPDVGTAVDRLAPRLLRRHVGGGAQDHAGHGGCVSHGR